MCRANGIDLYLGRNPWITWKKHSPHKQQRDDVYNPAYYTTYLSRIRAGARAIGAIGTFEDCEPYGDTIYKPWFKKDGSKNEERARVLRAIRYATAKVPPIDFAYPAGGIQPNHYSWPMRYLGKEFLHSKPFKVRKREKLRAAPPPGMPLQLDWWGTWLGVEQTAGGPLTVEEFLALDWPVIKTAHPELKGAWLFVRSEQRRQILHRLGETQKRKNVEP